MPPVSACPTSDSKQLPEQHINKKKKQPKTLPYCLKWHRRKAEGQQTRVRERLKVIFRVLSCSRHQEGFHTNPESCSEWEETLTSFPFLCTVFKRYHLKVNQVCAALLCNTTLYHKRVQWVRVTFYLFVYLKQQAVI